MICRGHSWAGRLIGLLVLSVASASAAELPKDIRKIDYLPGRPGQPKKIRGVLRFDTGQITFVSEGRALLQFSDHSVEYVAAQAQASMRARTADTGVAVACIAGVVFPPAYPIVFLFHKAERHLLSIEYAEDDTKQLALFNVRDHSARAVKKIIDDRLGLTPEYYRKRDREEEERKRQREAEMSAEAQWTPSQNTVIGDSQYARVLIEQGTYDVLLLKRYVGLRPPRLGWAKYRIPIREVKEIDPRGESLTPILKGSRVVGFAFNEYKYLFY